MSAAGAILAALLPRFLHSQNSIGGVDQKLLVALGALCQPYFGLELEIYGFFVAAVAASASSRTTASSFEPSRTPTSLQRNVISSKEPRREVEAEAMSWFGLGPCIFIGTAATAAFHWGKP